MLDDEDDPLERLRERIRSTADAADRLAGEARREGRGRDGAAADAAREAQALAGLVAVLRDLLPAELRQQLSDLVRQVLMLVRAVIDYYLLRLEAGPAAESAEPVVHDIPLD